MIFNTKRADLRSDVHVLATMESGSIMTECMYCGLPVPLEAGDDVYCDDACQDKHMEEALQTSVHCSCC